NLIRVNSTSGLGKLVLASGGITSSGTYPGDWVVGGGIVQIGPVTENKLYNAGAGYAGPFGEQFNALGFQGFAGGGDPDAPNKITLNTGSILALGIDHANQGDP